MSKDFLTTLACTAMLLATAAVHAGPLTSPVDGRSHYSYDYFYWPPTITRNADDLGDPILKGVASYPNSSWKERSAPVFEFQMDGDLFGESELEATFDFYVTEAGSDSANDGIQLRYAQGNGIVEYGDTSGTLITTVDPMVTGWRSIDVSAALQAAADGGWGWLRLTLYPDDWATGQDVIYVASSENPGYEPSIQIVPEPATAMLALSMGGLLFARRRR